MSIDRVANSINKQVFCKFENFRKNFIFCEKHYTRLKHNLPISVNDIVISPFREDFIFPKLSIYEVSRK